MKKLYIKILTALLLTTFYSCVTNHKICVKTIETDWGSNYLIVDSLSKKVIYDGGHNEIFLDTIINGNHIYQEVLRTEDCFRAYKIEDLNTAILGLEILEDYDYKGHCLLMPRHKEIPLFKSPKAITKIDYIINDTIIKN